MRKTVSIKWSKIALPAFALRERSLSHQGLAAVAKIFCASARNPAKADWA